MATDQPKPNILVILTDDQGWGDLSVNGNTNLETPNVDSLARDGAIFDRFYVCPVCAPTRAEFLTGRYHLRAGVHGVSTGEERLNLDEKTIGDTFKAAGYATAAFGKWHNGTQHPYHPNARGFDEFFGFCSGHWGQYFDAELEHNGELTKGEGYLADELTDRAMDFMAKSQDQPFFCYVPFNIPHTPFQVPDRFYDRFRDKDLELLNREPDKENVEATRAALALCENIDWNVGRMLEKLSELGISENTIVFYFGDNGPNGVRWNGGMKGRKGSTDEGGVRVPALMRWPGHIQPGTVISEISGAIDLLPTFADFADIPIVGDKPLDGLSRKPLLLGEKTEETNRMIFSHQRRQVSVRNQQYRLDSNGQLFDMVEDPGQHNNVAESNPEIAGKLRKAVENWCSEVPQKPETDSRPFPVGYRECPSTRLPARDGELVGNVQRSAGAPNCSFFTNWTELSDWITWDIEVETAGEYEATIYYTCPEADIGSTVEIAFAGTCIHGKVTLPNDPPMIGKEDDRHPRGGESYVKDFKPLVMGTFPMRKSRGKLALRAIDIPGNQVMDVRRVILKLLEN